MSIHAVDNLNTVWDSVDSLLSSLSDEQWATPSLCPGWTIADATNHISAVEYMMAGAAPGSFTDGLPFDKIGSFMGEMEEATGAETLARYRDMIAQRRDELSGVTEADLDLPSATPVGMKTFGRMLAIREFDCWIHELDMRVPLGIPGEEGGAAAHMAIDEIAGSLPYIIGKKIGLPDGKSITIELTGAAPRTMHAVVDGRAAIVESLDNPDVVLTADSTAFALLACGRIDPQGPIDDGRIVWSGIDDLGEASARNLAFTM
jgi:uncharacterized protein (TIGR03083 family)